MATLQATKVSIKSVLLAAIGGQGGNVLVEWLFLAAELDGRRAQALSLPGLSQRGGGTNFYLEIAGLENPSGDDEADEAILDRVQFAQFPFPGRVDVLVGQELVELGRLVQAGFATRRTTVVASSQRIYTIDEKMPAFDGVFPSDKIIEATSVLAGAVSIIDTVELARQNNLGELATNAILLGALSAVENALPMNADRYRAAIKKFGLAVDINLAAFEVGRAYQLKFNGEAQSFEQAENALGNFEKTQSIPVPGEHRYNGGEHRYSGGKPSESGAADSGSVPAKKPRRQINLTPIIKSDKAKVEDVPTLIASREKSLPPNLQTPFRRLVEEIFAKYPAALHSTLVEAIYQMIDYQNVSYAHRYLAMVAKVFEVEPKDATEYKLTYTYARTLAMRMTYEDATRVAVLKIKPGRLERIRRDMDVKSNQVLHVTDYLKPDAAEIYGIFPNALVSPMLLLGKVTGVGIWLGKKHFTLQQHPQVTTFSGYMTFRFLTWFKPMRPISHRFHQEWKQIEAYTKQVLHYAAQSYDLGVLVADSGRLIKGYGDTRRKMFSTVQRFYDNVLAPVVRWEERANSKDKNIVADYAVSLKTGQLALQLIGRSDEGIAKAEALSQQILHEAKAGTSRQEILAKLEGWAK